MFENLVDMVEQLTFESSFVSLAIGVFFGSIITLTAFAWYKILFVIASYVRGFDYA